MEFHYQYPVKLENPHRSITSTKLPPSPDLIPSSPLNTEYTSPAAGWSYQSISTQIVFSLKSTRNISCTHKINLVPLPIKKTSSINHRMCCWIYLFHGTSFNIRHCGRVFTTRYSIWGFQGVNLTDFIYCFSPHLLKNHTTFLRETLFCFFGGTLDLFLTPDCGFEIWFPPRWIACGGWEGLCWRGCWYCGAVTDYVDEDYYYCRVGAEVWELSSSVSDLFGLGTWTLPMKH